MLHMRFESTNINSNNTTTLQRDLHMMMLHGYCVLKATARSILKLSVMPYSPRLNRQKQPIHLHFQKILTVNRTQVHKPFDMCPVGVNCTPQFNTDANNNKMRNTWSVVICMYTLVCVCICMYMYVFCTYFFRIRQYASGTDLECIISSVPVPTGMAQRPSGTCSRASATRGLQIINFTGVQVRMCRPVTMEEAV